MTAVCHLGIVLPPCETTHEVPVKFRVNLIHRSEDIAVWIFHIFGFTCLLRPQNWCFWGLRTPKCDYSSSRPPKSTSLHKSASVKLSTAKIRWGVWPVGELTESVMDTQTHAQTGKFIFCPRTAVDRQKMKQLCSLLPLARNNCSSLSLTQEIILGRCRSLSLSLPGLIKGGKPSFQFCARLAFGFSNYSLCTWRMDRRTDRQRQCLLPPSLLVGHNNLK